MHDTFARCRALALAACIDAGGSPCWVAAAAGAPSAAAASAAGSMTPEELARLPWAKPALLLAMSRVFAHLRPELVAPSPGRTPAVKSFERTRSR